MDLVIFSCLAFKMFTPFKVEEICVWMPISSQIFASYIRRVRTLFGRDGHSLTYKNTATHSYTHTHTYIQTESNTRKNNLNNYKLQKG